MNHGQADEAAHEGIAAKHLGRGKTNEGRHEVKSCIENHIEQDVRRGCFGEQPAHDEDEQQDFAHAAAGQQGDDWGDGTSDGAEDGIDDAFFLGRRGWLCCLVFLQLRIFLNQSIVNEIHIIADDQLILTAFLYQGQDTRNALCFDVIGFFFVAQREAQTGSAVDDGTDIVGSADGIDDLINHFCIHEISSFLSDMMQGFCFQE